MPPDPDNVRLWGDADVYVSFDLGATVPADIDTDFSVDWNLIGLLDGDDGFTESRSEDSTDHFAWGGVLIRTARRNFKLTKTFTALEQNVNTDRLMWPGSTPGMIVTPSGDRVERVLVAFETRDGANLHRVISAYQAEITVDGDITENEPDLAKVKFMATIFPDSSGNLFTRQDTV